MIRKLCYLIALIICTITATHPIEARTRRAIVIGLGEQLDPSWGKINGDKDVPLVTDMLRANGFTDIDTLTNRRATKAAIVKSFKTLIAKARPGDIIYIHFSGHGQLMTDLNGDETDDQWDECWIPYDAFKTYNPKDHGEKHLTDDEIAIYLSQLRLRIGTEGAIAVVVDACHSGDSTRDTADDIGVVRGVLQTFDIPNNGSNSRKPQRVEEQWVTLSACRDYQLNQEYGGVGKLTHIMVTNWQSFANMEDNQVCDSINRLMQSRKYKGRLPQNPTLTGMAGKTFAIIFP